MTEKHNYVIFAGLVGALLLGTLAGGAYFYLNSKGNNDIAKTQESSVVVGTQELPGQSKLSKNSSSIKSQNSSSAFDFGSDSSDSKTNSSSSQNSSKSSTSSSSTESSQESSSQESISKVAKSGKITGTLSYPSEGIIGVNACAQNIANGNIYCTERAISNNQSNYEIDVPAGEYEVFSTSDISTKLRAYYDEHVTCGLTVECSSSNPSPKTIIVNVKNNESTNGINPANWYNSATYNNSNL